MQSEIVLKEIHMYLYVILFYVYNEGHVLKSIFYSHFFFYKFMIKTVFQVTLRTKSVKTDGEIKKIF